MRITIDIPDDSKFDGERVGIKEDISKMLVNSGLSKNDFNISTYRYSKKALQDIRKTRIKSVKPDPSLTEEKGWAGFNIRWLINDETMGAIQGTLGYAFFPPGSEHKMHKHDYAEEFTIYLSGSGTRVVGDKEYKVGPGDVAFVPRGVPHQLKNTDPNDSMALWCFYAGVPNVEKTGYKLVHPNNHNDV